MSDEDFVRGTLKSKNIYVEMKESGRMTNLTGSETVDGVGLWEDNG